MGHVSPAPGVTYVGFPTFGVLDGDGVCELWK